MVRPIGQQLGIDDILATRMVVRDGRYTGDVGFYNAGDRMKAWSETGAFWADCGGLSSARF